MEAISSLGIVRDSKDQEILEVAEALEKKMLGTYRTNSYWEEEPLHLKPLARARYAGKGPEKGRTVSVAS